MAAANLNDIRETIESRIEEEFRDNNPPYTIVYQNMNYTPEVETTWLQCLISFVDSEYLTLGGTTNSENRISGTLIVNIFNKTGIGHGDSLIIGKRIRDLYNRINISGVFFESPVGPEVMSSPSPQGYFQTQVRSTFQIYEAL
jgi:hypothetical protein